MAGFDGQATGLIDLTDLLQSDWYLANNTDVAAAGVDARVHYASTGRAEGRLPCPETDLISGLGPIDPATVTCTMPDVVGAGADLAQHVCQHGWRERRRPNAYFDPAWYRQNYGLGASVCALAHDLRHRRSQKISPLPSFYVASYVQAYAQTLPLQRDPYARFLAIGRFAAAGGMPRAA
jgi:hypothetical protein